MSDLEEAKHKHKKGDRVKVTKTIHKTPAGSTRTVHSVHYGVYYGVHGPNMNTTYVPQQHCDPAPPSGPPPSDPPPSGGGTGGTGGTASDLATMPVEEWLGYVQFLLTD